MNNDEPGNKSVFVYFKNAISAFIGISIILYLVAWRVFGFDLLKADGDIEKLYQKFPNGFYIVCLVYFVYAALKRGRAYKNDRVEADLVWAGLLWILATLCSVVLILNLFF